MKTISKKEIIEMYNVPEYTAIRLVREIKAEMVRQGFQFYDNKRLGVVPVDRVERALGIINDK